MQAFFRYDAQSESLNAIPQSKAVTIAADAATNVADASFMLGGPSSSGSAHGSYLASPIPKKYAAL